MNIKKSAVIIAIAMTAISALLLTMLPMSANLIVAYTFYQIGLLLMVIGVFLTERNNPSSFMMIFKCSPYLVLNLILSAIALSSSMKTSLHVILQIVLLLANLVKIALIDMGVNYIKKLDESAKRKREGK